jgi:excisionase family DNA binding protein
MKLKTLKKQTIISGRIIIIIIVKMENPFELILERLDRIEKAIAALNATNPIQINNAPMDIKDLSEYLKLSVSAIYKLTSTSEIPHYKSGKRLYFKKEDIDEWIFSHRIKTRDDIEKEAMEYLRKNPRRF